jgi:beta-barrel assembly-enhancing protease
LKILSSFAIALLLGAPAFGAVASQRPATATAVFQSEASALPTPAEQSLLRLRNLDLRVAHTAYRLASANVDLCSDRKPLTGFVIHHLTQYGGEHRFAAAAVFRLRSSPGVLLVVPNSPAARAGLMPNDNILEIGGEPLHQLIIASADAGFSDVEKLMDHVDSASSSDRVSLQIERGGQGHSLEVEPEQGCASRFQVVPAKNLRAKADGRYVQITSALVEDLHDEELAFVLAHELAHNILKHRVRINDAGRNSRTIRLSEIEADRLSVYLLDRAGFSPEASISFWNRFRSGPGFNPFGSATHLGWRKRAALLNDEIARLRELKKTDPRPMPPVMLGQ